MQHSNKLPNYIRKQTVAQEDVKKKIFKIVTILDSKQIDFIFAANYSTLVELKMRHERSSNSWGNFEWFVIN